MEKDAWSKRSRFLFIFGVLLAVLALKLGQDAAISQNKGIEQSLGNFVCVGGLGFGAGVIVRPGGNLTLTGGSTISDIGNGGNANCSFNTTLSAQVETNVNNSLNLSIGFTIFSIALIAGSVGIEVLPFKKEEKKEEQG